MRLGSGLQPGRQALSGSGDETVRLWDVETGKELRRFIGHSGQVFSVAFSPDGKRALSGSNDDTVRLWDVETGKELRSFEGHSETVWGVALSLDGTHALSGSMDKTMRLWQLSSRTGQRPRVSAVEPKEKSRGTRPSPLLLLLRHR